MLGHHKDDVYETCLHRILKHGTYGLRSLKEARSIPENHGVYGVDASGTPRDFYKPRNNSTVGVRGFESGGVQIFRPLISLTKSDLSEICLKNNVSWVEDPSNQDPALTMRNAIRLQLQDHALPVALRRDSIFAISDYGEATMDSHILIATHLYQSCNIQFNPALGLLVVRNPIKAISTLQHGTQQSVPINLNISFVVALFLRKFIQTVSPQATVATSSCFRTALSWVELAKDTGLRRQRHIFQANLVTIENLPEKDDLMFGRGQTALYDNSDTWTFFRHGQSQRHSQQADVSAVMVEIPPATSADCLSLGRNHLSNAEQQQGPNASYFLYDGRWWISIHNPSQHTLRIRPYNRDDHRTLLQQFRKHQIALSLQYVSSKSGSSVQLNARTPKGVFIGLNKNIPGNDQIFRWALGSSLHFLRHTVLPVIEYLPSPNRDRLKSEPRILAFPTLGLRVLPGSLKTSPVPEWVSGLSWIVRYKNLDWGAIHGHPPYSDLSGDDKDNYSRNDPGETILPVEKSGTRINRWRVSTAHSSCAFTQGL